MTGLGEAFGFGRQVEMSNEICMSNDQTSETQSCMFDNYVTF